ncbi:Orf39 [Heliothis zea nudivirus]|uniref:Orf39 n=1 Tax=Heliothis zea nudivirus 1 TaxID=3116536 RepID=Q8JKS2_9VIRU|nr:Orf39 [Heliothis zea nudivirus]AAN04334.1 Orf39 [Heliothis zea nudivirus]
MASCCRHVELLNVTYICTRILAKCLPLPTDTFTLGTLPNVIIYDAPILKQYS